LAELCFFRWWVPQGFDSCGRRWTWCYVSVPFLLSICILLETTLETLVIFQSLYYTSRDHDGDSCWHTLETRVAFDLCYTSQSRWRLVLAVLPSGEPIWILISC
jgi:hypothetical protein